MKNELEEIDELLAEVEDAVRGREGELITKARRLLTELIITYREKDD